MPTTDPNDIHLNEREEIRQMIGQPPSWMLYYGNTAMACVVLILLALSYFVKYPDVVTAKVVLTTEHPPIRILAKIGGRVSELLVKNNAVVQKGAVLAIMENTADWRDVLKLDQVLVSGANSFQKPSTNYKLGTLQTAYSTYSQNLRDYQYFIEQNGVLAKIDHLNQQIVSYKQLHANLLRQKEIQESEFALAEKELVRQKQLHAGGVVSDSEFEKFNAAYLQQKRILEANDQAIINNEMQVKQNEAQITDLGQGKNDNQNSKQLTLQEDVRRLKVAIDEWKQIYLIVAPIAGKVSMSKIWSAQQAIATGEEIFAVVPIANPSLVNLTKCMGCGEPIIAKALLPVANSGKVKAGLKSNIRLDAYPYQQYGMLEGVVQNVSLLPQASKDGDTYLLEISVNDSLVTTYNKKLTLNQEMQGAANITTEDRRVIERLFDRIRDLLKNRG
jgi:multidrug resistance efflux pump